MAKDKTDSSKTICRNKKASYKYEFLDKLECGIMLSGTEVKSLREGRGSLDEGFARIRNGEVWLEGFHIQSYDHGTTNAHIPTATRKLLLHKREIEKLDSKVSQGGMTLIPVSAYFNARGIVKVSLALAKGKTISDKRETLKERDAKREMERVMRQHKRQ